LYISGIFEIKADNGVIKATQTFEKPGEVILSVEVTDQGEVAFSDTHIDTTKVTIHILPGNFKKPEFLFPNKINSTLLAVEVSFLYTRVCYGGYLRITCTWS